MSALVEFRQPEPYDIDYVAATMRQADRNEVWASHHHTPYEALSSSLKLSQYAVTAWVDGVPVCIFGLVIHDIIGGKGVPWMLGSSELFSHSRDLLKHTPVVIDEMLRKCPKLYNHVHAANRQSVRWLKWLGFTMDKAEPFGVEGDLFHRFHQERV